MLKTFTHAIEGIFQAFKTERNLKIHLCFVIAVIVAGIYFQISLQEWIDCLLCFGLVISLELINTAVESTVDLVTQQDHPLAKRAKDIAAGAVLVSAIISAIIGLMIFLPKL